LGPNFSTCSGLGWVGLGQSADAWVGLDRVTKMGPGTTLVKT